MSGDFDATKRFWDKYPSHVRNHGDIAKWEADAAAQATAMARLLIKHEWHPHDETRDYCIECGGTRPDRDDRLPMGHVRGCALATALRAVGVVVHMAGVIE